jgi:hypothetical protein
MYNLTVLILKRFEKHYIYLTNCKDYNGFLNGDNTLNIKICFETYKDFELL